MRLDFAVTGLARSRTAWWAAFLSTESVSCRHEWTGHVYSESDYLKAKVPGKVSGISDTAFWLLGDRASLYASRILVIHRDPAEVRESILREYGQDIDFTPFASRLWAVKGMHVGYDSLSDPRVVADCYRFLTGSEPDLDRLALFCEMKITTTAGHINSMTPSHWATVEVSKCL